MATINNYEILKRLNSNPEIEIYRAFDSKLNKNIILKNISNTNEFNSTVVNLKNEYEIMKYLSDSNLMLNVYSFERHDDGYFLAMEDTEGTSLKEIIKNDKITLDHFFTIALGLSDLLLFIHKKKVIHKDIKPDNIILNNNYSNIRIIDFGISTRLSKEETKWSAPNVLEGSIHYISPEQTGRMNRSVDYRSDFYSLGITFYELLTGNLPFMSTDLLELVHSHLAKTPVSAKELNKEIPLAISKIIEKLMSKTAENRYQTAFGLKYDLEKCKEIYLDFKNQNKAYSEIDFELGTKDISDVFTIQQKLYGRDSDISILMEAFRNVKDTGKSEIILIAGYSGVGKSSLVREISKPITEFRGYFLNGKYDQFNKNMPFSAIIQVFTNIIRLILTETPEEISQWKEELQFALGINGKILTDVIPELEYIIGSQAPVVELGAQENANRFYLVFQNFIKVISNEKHPLAIFLDDLQWADSASLSLIQNLIDDDSVQYLFLMLAYRDNEIDKTHPLQVLLDDIEKTSYKIEKILLKPLNENSVKQLLEDSLHAQSNDISEIASLVLSKTGGNPFFINEFLKKLYRSDLIQFNYDKAIWTWNINDIRNVKVSENVVELLIDKISILPKSIQNILKYASCIGNIFDLSTLSQIHKKSLKETANELREAIDAEMIFPIGDTYKLADSMIEITENIDSNFNTSKNILYKFQHDRVQQASYEILDPNLKKSLRLEIARILYKNIEITKKEESLFDIVNHFNTGFDLVTDNEEIKLIINLNLQAGKKAKLSTAYKPALEYISKSYEILVNWVGENKAWSEYYSLTLNITKELAEVQYLNGNFEISEKSIQKILTSSIDPLVKGEAYNLLIIQYCSLGKYDKALEIINTALESLGESLPYENTSKYFENEIKDLNINLRDRKISDLLDETEMTDPFKKLTIKILTNSLPMAYNLKPELFPIISAKMVNIFLKNGMSAESYGISCYSIVLATGFSDFKNAYDFSLLAVKLSEKYNSQAEKTKGSNVLANYTTPFVRHLKNAENINSEGLQASYDSGEFLHGSYCAMNMCLNSFYQGEALNKVIYDKVDKLYHFATKVKSSLSIDTVMGVKIIVSNMLGITKYNLDFDIEENSELEFYNNCESHQSMFPVCLYKIMKAQVLFLYYEFQLAHEEILKAKELLPFISGQNSAAEFNFYYSLILASLYKTANKQTKLEYIKQIKINQKQMKTWAENCSENFLHKYLLVEAEIARLEYKNWKAAKFYDEAIAEAKKNDFVQNEALCNELAGRFWNYKKNIRSAKEYMISALKRYESWGAVRKIEQLKSAYLNLIIDNTTSNDVNTSYNTNSNYNGTITNTNSTTLQGSNTLDLQSIIKSSSAISGEIRLENLLHKIMNIVIENVGAERGILLLKSKNDFFIEAEGSTKADDVKIRTNISLKNYKDIPHSLIYYVERTKEFIVLHDAIKDDKFNKDSYIKNNLIKSILCCPVLKQGELTGILYVENNLSTGVFTEDRLQVIKILASQAAISIDNALLYSNMEQRVEERTIELKEANDELAEKNKHITDSIQYAKTIQEAILPTKSFIKAKYDDFFISFYPKDIVSGDFFWYAENEESSFIAAVDCTGHGVPGAFMSMIGSAILNQIVKELKIYEPALILNHLNRNIRIALKQDVNEDASRDGMEICLCRVDKDKVVFSGGHRPLFMVKNGEFFTYKGDKDSIGGKQKTDDKLFTNIEIPLERGIRTAFYLTTDGFQDQPNTDGKKIGSKGLHEIIMKYNNLDGMNQKLKFAEELKNHAGPEPQRDDITVIGILFN
jgi:predicted ATPase/GAF domain-containing protein